MSVWTWLAELDICSLFYMGYFMLHSHEILTVYNLVFLLSKEFNMLYVFRKQSSVFGTFSITCYAVVHSLKLFVWEMHYVGSHEM